MKTKEQLVWDSFPDEYKKDLRRDAKAAAYYEKLFHKGYKFCRRCYGKGCFSKITRVTGSGDFDRFEVDKTTWDYVDCSCTRWTWWEVVLHFIRYYF